jgi:transferrin receptor-like protein
MWPAPTETTSSLICDKKGLPDRPWFQHLIYACRYPYLPLVLPGLTEAVEGHDTVRVREREEVLAAALHRAAQLWSSALRGVAY